MTDRCCEIQFDSVEVLRVNSVDFVGRDFEEDVFGHTAAVEALSTIRQSKTFNILPVGKQTFETISEEFERFGDRQISFVDQTSAVLAREHEIEHLFAFDSDFSTMGFERVPVHIET